MSKHILVIDDEVEFVDMVKERLKANGYIVTTAHDGSEGLGKIRQKQPDLILMDIKMAKMDGYTTLRRIREDERTKDLPVVMLTAYAGMKELFALEGVNDFILKPFDDQDLLLRIARALK